MTKIALIDHNDSFTYNIVEVLRQFTNTFTVINYQNLVVADLNLFDKIILSPGPCLPKDYPKTFQIIENYYKSKPILGICLGHQAICTFFGAQLYRFDDVVHGVSKTILRQKTSKLFKNIPQKTTVGLYHSWAIDQAHFPSDLSVLAKADGIIMSVEHVQYPVFGIQFHPESFLTTHGALMLKNFIDL